MYRFMKRILVVAAVLVATMATAMAQMPLPTDPQVRVGKLDNGLTYYIRHNEMPKGQADFYIAQRVGSMLEEDNQRGLAHFLEHMCFNGTKNFPGDSLIKYLEGIGVRFGQNLNAYTSWEETVYNISNVPVARESVQDSCLLILHDWANALLLADEEIDAERGVIHQEWRSRNVGSQRLYEALLPKIMPDSKYGVRFPIGTMEVVDNFPYQALRDYYHAWYRPDQQGVIVVGDIDVDSIEAKIKKMFSPIVMPADAPAREYQEVADNEGTLYGIGADKEMSVSVVELYFKQAAIPAEMKGDAQYLVFDYMMSVMSRMLNARLAELASKPDASFLQASFGYDKFIVAKTKDALALSVVVKGADTKAALASAYRELLRAQRGGFTVGEYERAKSELLSRIEKKYNDRANRQNEEYVNEYVENFLDNEPIPGIETEYQLMQMLVNQIPVEAINMAIAKMITADNRAMMVMQPEKEGYTLPTEAELAKVIADVDAETIEAYVDEMKSEPLIPNLPAKGSIVSERTNEQWGATEWTLSNGVKVLVKPTTFKDNEILFSAVAKGGYSAIADASAADVKFMPLALQKFGLGTYTNTDLKKYTAGKQVSVSFNMADYTREVSGTSTPQDLPTLMELIYMSFAGLNLAEDEYTATQNMYAGVLRNRETTPEFVFGKTLRSSCYENERKHMLTAADVEAARREGILDLCKRMTANAADYTFVFIGNVDEAALRPLVEQYIATLPGDASAVAATVEVDPTLEMKLGRELCEFTTAMETPQTWVCVVASAQLPYTIKNRQLAAIAGSVLDGRFHKKVREEMGAVYSISADGYMSRIGSPNAFVETAFPMKPEFKQEVLDYIASEFKAAESNVQPEELKKAVEFMVKEAKEKRELNSGWLAAIEGYTFNGVDTFNELIDTLSAITVDEVEAFIKQLNEQNNYRVITLDPK